MYISSTNSTNTLLKELLARGEWPEGERFLRAGYQTAGRGQAGNGWESEEDQNLLYSILIERRKIKDKSPFYLNVAVSVAVHKTISGLGIGDITIKWPNDIYWRDKKVAGILVENAIIGSELKYSIVGIGLNVNQTEWRSDAPNPVSLKQILAGSHNAKAGNNLDPDELMQRLADETEKALDEDMWGYYKAHLYRREGYWPYVEREVSVDPTMNAGAQAEGQFLARIADILPTGEMVLEDKEGNQRKYHFKQVRYVI